MGRMNYLNKEKIDPAKIAIVWYENEQRKELTYAELQRAVAQRTHYFVEELKINNGEVVGVVAPRGPEYLINMLALWHIGAIYLPISDAWKESGALKNRLDESGACCLLTVNKTYQAYKNELVSWSSKIKCLDEVDFSIYPNSDFIRKKSDIDFAYIFSSSGTTGKPKLIALPHAGILERIEDHVELMRIGENEGVLGFIDFGFDASVVEMLLAIHTGNTLYITDQTVREGCYQQIPAFIKDHNKQIHVAILLPSVLKEIDAKDCPGLTKIVTMGEACLLDNLRENHWFDQAAIYNGYGPTETTFGATLTQLNRNDTVPSIHRPMRGITLYLRDIETKKILAETDNQGIWELRVIQDETILEGEILIGGAGIGTYLNLPDKTKEKFLTAAEAKLQGFAEEPLFLSGDIAQLNGTQLIYQNRMDNQIKRYGVLIKLEEVEAAFRSYPEIKDVVAIEKEGTLMVFVSPQNKTVMMDDIFRKKIGNDIKSFIFSTAGIDKKFRPNVLLWVDEIPKQAQRDKLSRQLKDYESLKLLRVLPTTAEKKESEIAKIWQEILEPGLKSFTNVESVSYDVDTKFEEMGGDSLLTSAMIQKVWRYHSKEKMPAPLSFSRAIIENPTIYGIQQLLTYWDHKFFQSTERAKELVLFAFPSQHQLNPEGIKGELYKIFLPSEILLTDSNQSKTLLSLLKSACREITEDFFQFVCDSAEKPLVEKLVKVFEVLGITCALTVISEQNLIETLNDRYESYLSAAVEKKRKQLYESFLKTSEVTNPLYKLVDDQTKNTKILILNVLGLSAANLFEAALEREFPRWQWDSLRKQRLSIFIENYDAVNRLDCPNLCQQAKEAGFTQVDWAVSLRKTYWLIYQNELTKFLNESHWYFIEESLPLLVNNNELIHWFKQEYRRKQLSPSAITESDFIWQAFKTLHALKAHYPKNISLALESSHWERKADLPCVHALPQFPSVLPLLESINTTTVKIPDTWQIDFSQYEQAQQNLGFSAESIYALQNKVDENFWNKFASNAQARLHVLPLQHVEGSTPIFIFHPLTGDTPIYYRTFSEALGPKQSVYALQMSSDDSQITSEAKAQLYFDYIKTIQPKGPYVLMGWSFGAVLAYHVALLLEQNQNTVDWVINLDSPPPEHIQKHSIAARALDMISVLAKEVYEIQLDIEKIKTAGEQQNSEQEKVNAYFKQAIAEAHQQNGKIESFILALEKAKLNLQIYYDFTQFCINKKPKLEASYWVFEATQDKRAILNGANFIEWQNYCVKPIKLNQLNATHFNLFQVELFHQLQPVLRKYQAHYQGKLSERLERYHQQRIEVFAQQQKNSTQGIYIEAQADHEHEGKQSFALQTEIEKFLTDNGLPEGANCFLLQGDPGSGKSHYGRQLEHLLWTEQPCRYFPLFINLKPGKKNYLKTALLEAGLFEEEYELLLNKLKKSTQTAKEEVISFFGAPLFIIFDGYDEALTEENFYKQEELNIWHAKVFISCRTYAVTDFRVIEQFGDAKQKIKTVYLQAFQEKDIENYLLAYEKIAGKKLSRDQLKNFEQRKLLQSPLLLSIAVECWNGLSSYSNRAALYRDFFVRITTKEVANIPNQNIRPQVDLIKCSKHYSQKRAVWYWHQLEKVFETVPDNLDSQLAQKLHRLGVDMRNYLSHITFWEYHLAEAIIDIVLTAEQDLLVLLGKKTLTTNLSLMTMVQELAQFLPDEQYDQFCMNLLNIVYASRVIDANPQCDAEKVQAASNSISLLNVMRVSFSDLDLRNIRIPGAYLNHALFDTTCLRGANLSNTKLQNALLRFADLRETDLTNVDFGQLPPLALTNPGEYAGTMALSQDGQLAVISIGEEISRVAVWNVWKRERLLELPEIKSNVSFLIFSPDGEKLAVSTNASISIWNINTKQLLTTFEDPDQAEALRSIAFSPDGQYLACYSSNKKILLWNLQNKNIETTLSYEKFSDFTFDITFSPDGKQLISATGKQLILWDLNAETYTLLNGHTNNIWSVVFNAAGTLLASAGKDKMICVWDIDKCKKVGEFKTNNSDIRSLAFSANGKILVSGGGQDHSIYLWDVEHQKSIITLTDHVSFAQALTFGSNDHYLMAANDGDIYFWDMQSLSYQNLPGHPAAICHVSFSSDKKSLISIDAQSISYTWDIQTKKLVAKKESKLPSVFETIYSQDGLFSAASTSSTIKITNTKTKRTITIKTTNGVSTESRADCLAFFPNKNILVSGGINGIYLWDVNTGKCLAFTRVPLDYINSIAVNEEGLIAIGSQDTSVMLLKPATNKPWLHYVVVARFQQNPPLNVEKTLLDGCDISNMNRELLEQDTSITNPLKYLLWSEEQLEQTQIDAHIVDIASSQQDWQITFTETSPRRLVYLLSTTYLLTAALNTAMEMGLVHRLQQKPVSEYWLYQSCRGMATAKIKQLLRFLTQHGVLNYDEIAHTVALTALGESLGELYQFSLSERTKLANQCKISYENNSLKLTADSALELLAGMYSMEKFSRALHVCAVMRTFDAVASGYGLRELYQDILQTGLNPVSSKGIEFTSNFLISLETLKRFKFLEEPVLGKYRLTLLGEYLRSDHTETLQPTLDMLDKAWWQAVNKFYLGTMPAFEKVNEKNFFTYLSDNPEVQSNFNNGLVCLTRFQDQHITNALQQHFQNTVYDLATYRRIVDIAGNTGQFLQKIHACYPNHELTLYDQSVVIHDAEKQLTEWQPHFIGGSFFDEAEKNNIPNDQDLYFIKGTLHDFNDEQCVKILTHIREAMPQSSYLYVIERTMQNNQQPDINDYGDLMMLMLLGGKGRYAYEWLQLFVQAGLVWVNEKESLQVEDHTVMICKPSESISMFFKSVSIDTSDVDSKTLCQEVNRFN